MKIYPEHYDALKQAVQDTFEEYGKENVIADYEQGKFARADKVKDIQKRFCFDILHAACVDDLLAEIHEYANNDHIFTALKRICPVVERKYKTRGKL